MEEVLCPGNVAVVTGAASGIGQALAVRLSELGMRVAVADVNEEALSETSGMMLGSGHLAATVDVRDSEQVDAFADRVFTSLGPVQLLCNNAGIVGEYGVPIWETSPEDWLRVMAVNVVGVANGVRAFVPRMLSAAVPGHVMNTASIAGLVLPPGAIAPSYSASKHAIIALTDSLRVHLAERGAPIAVTALCPGPVATNIVRNSPDMQRTLPTDAGPDSSRDTPNLPGHGSGAYTQLTPHDIVKAAEAAIRSGRPYCFPHGGADELLRERFAALLSV